jgi:hypothetical protein
LYPYNLVGWHSPFDKKLNFVSSELIVPVHSDGKICKQWKVLALPVIPSSGILWGSQLFPSLVSSGDTSYSQLWYSLGIPVIPISGILWVSQLFPSLVSFGDPSYSQLWYSLGIPVIPFYGVLLGFPEIWKCRILSKTFLTFFVNFP